MKTIVVATDGSPSAAGATAQAIELAAALDATLVAVCAEELGVRFSMYEAPQLNEDFRELEQARVDRVLADVADAATARGVRCETAHLVGPVAEEICEEAARREASFVVVGSHGWGTLGRVLHGSVSSEVLYRARCPVLVVRGDAPEIRVAEPERPAAAAS